MSKQRARLAKLTRPRLHAPVKRTRLFKLLDQGKHHPITWVSGPPGSGKTTLVASYLEARKLKTFWYQVDEGDRDPASLFYYLGEVAKQSRNRRRASLPFLTAEYLPDLAGFARRYFRELFRRFGTNAALVLDNCQDAASDTFHLILRAACAEIPAGLRVFALSRSAAPAQLSRQVTSRSLLCVGWKELKLSNVEAKAIVRSAARMRESEAMAFNHECDGWVGGLILLLACEAGPHPTARAFATKEAVFDYFAAEVWAKQSAQARKVLMHTALLPYTTLSMALRISRIENCKAILDTLYRKQYFVDCKVDGELTYQYHDLFRQFLLGRLNAAYPQRTLAALRRKAARIAETSGAPDVAAQLFIEGHDWINVARLVKAHAESMIGHGRWQTLLAWCSNLPKQLMANDAMLLCWYGVCRLHSDPSAGKRILQRAYAKAVASGEMEPQALTLCYFEQALWLTGSSLRQATAKLAAHELVLNRLLRKHRRLTLETWLTAVGIAIYRKLRSELIDVAIDQIAADLRHGSASPAAALEGASMAMIILLHRADVARTKDFLLLSEDARSHPDIGPVAHCQAVQNIGHYAFFVGDYSHAIERYTEAGASARRCASDALYIVVSSMRVIVLSQLNHLTEARAQLSQLESISARFKPNTFCLARAYLSWALGWYAWKCADPERAYQEQKRGVQYARESAFLMVEDEAWTMLAIYAAELGRPAEALRHLAYSRRQIRAFGEYFTDSLVVAIRAKALLDMGDRSAALRELSNALRLAASNEIKAGALRWIEPWLPELFSLALEQGFEPAFVTDLIERWRLPPAAQASEHWPWPIKIRALGVLDIRLNGEPYTSSTKSHYRVLQLLKVLLALGGREVAIDAVAEHLWPDADGDAAVSNLRTVLHRLRKLLGRDDALVIRDNNISLNKHICWVDVWAFDQLSAASNGKGPSAATPRLETAVHLYGGHFLPNETGAWALAPRERLRWRFQHCVLALASDYQNAAREEAAESLLHECLERDPSAEIIYRHLMLHLKNRGRHLEALNVYRRCQRNLHSLLAARPAAETTAVYQALLRQ